MPRDKSTWLQIRIDQDLKARLEIAAGSRGMSDAVREAIELWLEQHEGGSRPVVHTDGLSRPMAWSKVRAAKPFKQLSPAELTDKL